MTVTIDEVMNNTSSVLHYENQQTGLKFDIQPTGNGAGYISASAYQRDKVPWKSSGKRIIITLGDQDSGQQYAVCDESWRFSVTSLSSGVEKTTSSTFVDGADYIVRVDERSMVFIKYDQSLRKNGTGLKTLPSFAATYSDPGFTVTF